MPSKRVLQLVVAVFFWAPVALAVPRNTDVVIIGAGLSGLATAYNLKKAGLRYHVLELTPRIGGRVRTVHYQHGKEDVYADSGMEEYWESNPAVRILGELKLPTRSDIALSSMVLEKRLVVLGDEDQAGFLKKALSEPGYAALEAFKRRVAPWVGELHARKTIRPELMKLKDVSFARWIRDQGLPPRVTEWIRISIECEIGTGWDKVSALDGIAELHIFLGGGEKSYRVLGGNEKFTDALAANVGARNISTNKKVTRVVSRGGEVVVYFLDGATNANGMVRAKHVVSTIPLFRLSEVQFDPPLSEKKRQAIATQGWGAYFKAHILLPPDAEKFWLKDGASTLPILSDSELGVIYDGNPDQKGKTRILSFLVTGDHAETFTMMPLDQVRGIFLGGVEKLWPGIGRHVKGIEFYRYHPRAIAAWGPGRSRFDELSEEIRRPENHVHLAGDFTESSHSDGAFLSAERVVKQILSPRNDAEARNTTLVRDAAANPTRSSAIRKWPQPMEAY